MDDDRTLTVNEQPIAERYEATGEVPDDPFERRILDYLFTAGLVKERTGNESKSPKRASKRGAASSRSGKAKTDTGS